MRILLTGATGFIGSHVARLLINTEHEVSVLVLANDDLWRIQDIVPGLNIVRANLGDHDSIRDELVKIRPDMCLHLAWYLVPGKYLAAYENVDMLTDSLRLATILVELNCKRLVSIGTCFEYGMGTTPLSEASPTKPRTLYAASKLALYTVLEQLGNLTGMEIAWLRPFYLYGPYEQEQRLVPSVIISLLRDREARVTNGEQVRDFLHVEDVAAAIWAVVQSGLTGPVNIGSGKPVTVREIIQKIAEIIGKLDLIAYGAVPYSPDDPMYVCADNKKLVQNTQWSPQYDLEHGLRRTVAWWQANLPVLNKG